MWLPVRQSWLLAGLCLLAPATAPAQTASVSPPELFELAAQLVAAGRTQDAEAAYRALADDRDPEVRTEARFRHAQLLVASKRNAEAALLLRRILDEKPQASRVRLELARVLANLGEDRLAAQQFRAVSASDLPPEVARMVDRYSAALRSRAPIGGTFSIALAPDSNINRATRADTLGTIIGDFNLNEDARARSGVGMATDATGFFRQHLNEDVNLLASASASGRLYREHDFNDVSLGFRAGPEISLGSNRLALRIGYSRRWFGGRRFADLGTLSLDWSRSLRRTVQLRLGGSLSATDNHFNHLEDGRIATASAGLEFALSPVAGIGVSGASTRRAFEDPGYSGWTHQLGLFGYRELGRTTLSAALSGGSLRSDARLFLYPEARKDRQLRATIGATFRKLTVKGFAPMANFTFERNKSNISVYDYRRRALEIGVNRAF